MSPLDRIRNQRRWLLDHARDLARSGQHADHKSIVAELKEMEGFASAQARFQEYAFLAQLDRMCRMAREAVPSGEQGARSGSE